MFDSKEPYLTGYCRPLEEDVRQTAHTFTDHPRTIVTWDGFALSGNRESHC